MFLVHKKSLLESPSVLSSWMSVFIPAVVIFVAKNDVQVSLLSLIWMDACAQTVDQSCTILETGHSLPRRLWLGLTSNHM